MGAFRNATVAAAVGRAEVPRPAAASRAAAPDLSLRIHTDLAAVEGEWRRFEQVAEGTPFQTFEWLSAWHRHIGARAGIVPAIVVGCFADGMTAFILPLAVEPRRATRRLTWLGQDLCDYNAPLLARDFSQRVTAERFVALWFELRRQIERDPQLRHDWVFFEKMPQTVGVQINPFTRLGVTANANSAHLTQLGDAWETFYRTKRSSATRRRDRRKRENMEEFGEIRFRTAANADDVRGTLETLWEQKRRIFARKGIADLFARPGHHEFFLDFATNPQSRQLAHISRIDIDGNCVAANFAIVFGDCYYHVLSSYCDGQLARYGPGMLHLRELMAYAIGRGLRRFDFTIGDESYKSEWCDLSLQLFDYSAATTWRGVPANAASKLLRRAKRFIKQTPALWRLASKLRATWGALTRPRAA